MITGYLLDLVYLFVLGIVSLVGSFGDVTSDNVVTTAFSTLSGYYAALDPYIPIATILAIVAFEIAFETSYFLYKLIRWGYQKVPGVN